MKITQIIADFTQYPAPNPEKLGLAPVADYPQELTIGDLSGNLVMLVWVLITAGLAQMSEENYLALVRLQQDINDGHKKSFNPEPIGKNTFLIDVEKVAGLTVEQYNAFKHILAGITFKPNAPILLRLLGDEVTERLGDDSEIIETLDQMAMQGLLYRILGSNHLHMLVQNFLSQDGYDEEDLIPNGQGVSLLHMLKSIKNGVVDEDSIRKKIANIYQSRLNLIDYSKGNNDNTMSLYAHGLFSLHRIVKAAEFLDVPIPDKFWNTDQVISFIDSINAEFKKTYVDVYFSGKSKQNLPELDDKTMAFASQLSPIGALFWMKDHEKIAEDPVPACFEYITFERLTHGHTNGPFSLNSDCTQAETSYTFSVAVATLKPENNLRDTDSPVALIPNVESKPCGFLPHYLRSRSSTESGNSSPAPSAPTSGNKHQ